MVPLQKVETDIMTDRLSAEEKVRLKRLLKRALLTELEKFVILNINPLVPEKGYDLMGMLGRLQENVHSNDVLSIRISQQGVEIHDNKLFLGL